MGKGPFQELPHMILLIRHMYGVILQDPLNKESENVSVSQVPIRGKETRWVECKLARFVRLTNRTKHHHRTMICIRPTPNNPRHKKSPQRQRTPPTREVSLELFSSDDEFFGTDFRNENSVEWAENAFREDSIQNPFGTSSALVKSNDSKYPIHLDSQEVEWKAKFDTSSELSGSFSDLAAKRSPRKINHNEELSTSQPPKEPNTRLPPPPLAARSPPTLRAPPSPRSPRTPTRQLRRASLASPTRVAESPKRVLISPAKHGGKRFAKSPHASRVTQDGKIERISPRRAACQQRSRRASMPSGKPTAVAASRETRSPTRQSPRAKAIPKLSRQIGSPNLQLFTDKQQRRRSTGAGPSPSAWSPTSTGTGVPAPRKIVHPRGSSPRSVKGRRPNPMQNENEGTRHSPAGKKRTVDPILSSIVVSPQSERKQRSIGPENPNAVSPRTPKSHRSPKKIVLKPVNKRSPQKERSPRRRSCLGSGAEYTKEDQSAADSVTSSKFQRKPLTISPLSKKTTRHLGKSHDLLDHLSRPSNAVRPKRSSMPFCSTASIQHETHDTTSVCTSMSTAQRKALFRECLLGDDNKDDNSDDSAPKPPMRHKSRSPTNFPL